MGKKNKKNQVKEEEIDLGKLFSLIGNVFSKFFKFIGKILKVLFHYFILLLIFIREHIIKIGVASILGIVIGTAIDLKVPDKYTYDMIIEPNYGSIDQIFEKMEYYNVLINEKDSITLKKEFNISYKEANKLVQFKLKPYETKKDLIIAYNEFIEEIDTAAQKHITFNDFIKEDMSKFDSKRYVYRIVSLTKDLTLFKDKILSDIEKNTTIQKRKRLQLNILKLDSIAVKVALKEIDSLRSLYRKAILFNAQKDKKANNTYFNFSKESNVNNNDIELFEIAKSLNEKLIKIEEEKETSEEVVNVITNFNSVGVNRGPLTVSYKFILGYLFATIILAFLLLKNLNQYLIDYKNQNTELI